MTPEEKIAALVEHIKKELPEGCVDVKCSDCPLNGFADFTDENTLCGLLAYRAT